MQCLCVLPVPAAWGGGAGAWLHGSDNITVVGCAFSGAWGCTSGCKTVLLALISAQRMLRVACALIMLQRSRLWCISYCALSGNTVGTANTDGVRDSWGGALLIASPSQAASSVAGSVRITECVFTNNTAQVSTSWHDACACACVCASLSVHVCVCACGANVAVASLHMHQSPEHPWPVLA